MVNKNDTLRSDRPDVTNILAWREELIQLNDELFFDLIRMYLTDIKTPFSKEKLVESLSAFLRKNSTRNAIYNRISNDDKVFITAISIIPEVTLEKLVSFFNNTIPAGVVYNKIVNLQERLIVFIRKGNPKKNESEDLRILDLNPMLPFLKSCVDLSLIFPSFYNQEIQSNDFFGNNIFSNINENNSEPLIFETIDLVIGCLIKLIVDDVDAVKQDGKIKKRFRQTIAEKIPSLRYNEDNDSCDIALILLDGIQRLGLTFETQGKTEPDRFVLNKFSQLSCVDRFIYLFVASSLNVSFDKITALVCFVSCFIKTISDKECTKEECSRIMFLLKEKFLHASEDELSFFESMPKTSRLSSVLHRQNSESNEATLSLNKSEKNKDDFSKIKEIRFSERDFDNIISNGVSLGVFEEKNNRISVSKQWKVFSESENTLNKTSEGSILIDSTGTVTIFSSINLSDYLSVLTFLEPETIQTAGIFAITKKSVQQAFSRGEKPESCTSLLKKLSGHDLPQNLEFSFADWYRSWQGALLYSGVVLCLEENRIAVVEQNPEFQKLCKKKLAPGVYLMNSQSRSFVVENLKNSGVEVFDPPESSGRNNFSLSCSEKNGDIPRSERRTADFYSSNLMPNLPLFSEKENKLENEDSVSFENNYSEEILSNNDLLEHLSTLEISDDIKTALNARISRNVILFPSQLDSRSVRFQKLEANAMDFSGKIRLVKCAISEQAKLDISYLSHDGKESNKESISGFPISIEYKMGDEIVLFKPSEKFFDDVELISIPLSQVTFVKLIPNSIFFKVKKNLD